MEEFMIQDVLQFHAEMVEGSQQEYSSDNIVHGIYFGEGDPEENGQHWNFTRNLNTDDGVCTVKEIQEITAYNGIDRFSLTRQNLTCEFDDQTAEVTGIQKLIITFDLDDETWETILQQAKFVFKGENYFDFVP